MDDKIAEMRDEAINGPKAKPITIDELFSNDFEPAWLVRERRELKYVQDRFLLFVFKLRYGNVESCFKCHKPKSFYLIKGRRAFACQFCGRQIFPLAGTSLHKSSTPIKKWLEAAELLKQQVTAVSLMRKLRVTYKTAWRIKKVVLEDFARHGILYAFTFGDVTNIDDELLTHYSFSFTRQSKHVGLLR